MGAVVSAAKPRAVDDLPHVSVVIPARNCATELQGCLDAVNAQTYRGRLEVIVAVAPSSDDTEQVASRGLSDGRLRVVANPAGTTSSGLNRASAVAEGEIIVRVDAQARLPADYVEKAVATIARTGAANVGGVQRPVGDAGLRRVIAAALAAPFGGGPAAFRRGEREGPADTVYLGVFDAGALALVGGFDETLKRNQDYELNWRLRERGYVVWLDPGLVVDYRPRSSYSRLARQYFDYGAWKRVVVTRHPRSVRPRQLAAPALVGALAIAAIDIVRGRLRGVVVPLVYAGACVVAATRLGKDLPRVSDRNRAAAAFAVMHISWGAGFLFGAHARSATDDRPGS